MNRIKFLAPILMLLLATQVLAQENILSIIPQPLQVKTHESSFTITPQKNIVVKDYSYIRSANFLNYYLKKYYGFVLPIRNKGEGIILDNLKTSETSEAPQKEGSYKLSVNKNNITIYGADKEGLGTFYGIQTLIQLLPTKPSKSLKVPGVEIVDAPRFSYRGLHLDVGRHYMPVEFIKQYIDLIALHKLNVFHWHLTEDQGWRIEIKRYPKLTEIGAWRNGTIIGRLPGKGNDGKRTGGYYTQEEIKEIVQYAQDRYVTIIPEIELPGHASAAIAAYPELSVFPERNSFIAKNTAWSGSREGKQVQQTWGVFDDIFVPSENTFTFLENVLDEVLALFPSKYIHIGGDEAPKKYWEESAFCQELMQKEGLKDAHELQSYFIKRIEQYLNSKGRAIIGWDEILEGGLAPNATVMSWRGEKGGIAAANMRHDVIMTPERNMYFDYSQLAKEDSVTIGGYSPIQKVYNYDPVPQAIAPENRHHILGAQANVWTEYMPTPSKVLYMILPRLAALSEVVWTQKEQKNYTNFKIRLPKTLQRYELWKLNYNKQWDGQPDKK